MLEALNNPRWLKYRTLISNERTVRQCKPLALVLRLAIERGRAHDGEIVFTVRRQRKFFLARCKKKQIVTFKENFHVDDADFLFFLLVRHPSSRRSCSYSIGKSNFSSFLWLKSLIREADVVVGCGWVEAAVKERFLAELTLFRFFLNLFPIQRKEITRARLGRRDARLKKSLKDRLQA